MCNRYENRGSVSQIRKLAANLNRKLSTTSATDNLRPQDNIYPDQDAAIVTNAADGGLELKIARWGFPPIPGQSAPITNIRNLNSRWWRDVNREWITDSAYRCLVPFTAFAEPVRESTWFYVPDVEVAYFRRRLASVAWRASCRTAGAKAARAHRGRDWTLFSFLTTEANDVVRPMHEKAMPVILIDPAEQSEWLGGGESSLRLQRPLPNAQLEMRETLSSDRA